MSRLHLAEGITLFAREPHSLLGNLTKSPPQIGFSSTDRPYCFALHLLRAISKVNAIIPREGTRECGFFLFTQ